MNSAGGFRGRRESAAENILKILIKLLEKKPAGGATMNELINCCEIPVTDTSINRYLRRIEQSLGVTIERKQDSLSSFRRYLLDLNFPEKNYDSGTALLFALSLFPQQRSVFGGYFNLFYEMVIQEWLGRVGDFMEKVREVEKNIYISGPVWIDQKKITRVMRVVVDALRRRLRLKMHYLSGNQGRVDEREVDPLGLVCKQQVWYLVGHCYLRGRRRTFRLDQIQDVRVLESSPAIIPESFSLKEEISGTWGIWDGEEEIVRLKVSPDLAYKFKLTCYHESQDTREHSDGSLLVAFVVRGAVEMVPWLLQWGAYVEVLEPQWLRDEISATSRKMFQLYSRNRIKAVPVRYHCIKKIYQRRYRIARRFTKSDRL